VDGWQSTISTGFSGKDEDMQEPQKPGPGECCGSGCAVCVWDIYREELEDYLKWKAKKQSLASDLSQSTSSSLPLKPVEMVDCQPSTD